MLGKFQSPFTSLLFLETQDNWQGPPHPQQLLDPPVMCAGHEHAYAPLQAAALQPALHTSIYHHPTLPSAPASHPSPTCPLKHPLSDLVLSGGSCLKG